MGLILRKVGLVSELSVPNSTSERENMRNLIIVAVLALVLLVGGCSTINGVGKDLQRMTSDYQHQTQTERCEHREF